MFGIVSRHVKARWKAPAFYTIFQYGKQELSFHHCKAKDALPNYATHIRVTFHILTISIDEKNRARKHLYKMVLVYTKTEIYVSLPCKMEKCCAKACVNSYTVIKTAEYIKIWIENSRRLV